MKVKKLYNHKIGLVFVSEKGDVFIDSRLKIRITLWYGFYEYFYTKLPSGSLENVGSAIKLNIGPIRIDEDLINFFKLSK